MNTIFVYFVEVVITLMVCCSVVLYLRKSMRRILVDLCRTEERAQFWMVFASILLVGLPLIFGMGYHPVTAEAEKAFFEVVNQIKWNLLGFLTALVVIGGVISFFALVAPRPIEHKGG